MVREKECEIERFVTFVLEMYKFHHNQKGWETLQLFLKYDVINFLKEYYTVISSEHVENIIADIDELIQNHSTDWRNA